MRHCSLPKRFIRDEDGAVTVDFVVLTAGVVAAAIFVMSPFGLAPVQVSEDTNQAIAEARERIFSDDFLPIGQ